jgi:hypothetical protein
MSTKAGPSYLSKYPMITVFPQKTDQTAETPLASMWQRSHSNSPYKMLGISNSFMATVSLRDFPCNRYCSHSSDFWCFCNVIAAIIAHLLQPRCESENYQLLQTFMLHPRSFIGSSAPIFAVASNRCFNFCFTTAYR